MDSGDEVRAHLNTLHEAVCELAATSLALRDPAAVDPEVRRAAEHVLVEAADAACRAREDRPRPR